MKKLLISTAIMALAASAAMAEAPAGANSANCDPTQFVAVRSEKTGEILYWNNPTCKRGESSVKEKLLEEEEEEEEEEKV